ncbi:tetratricopeptide repeat protein [bacterium]|nr:tetratricopeptide repeat protein [bacterium]
MSDNIASTPTRKGGRGHLLLPVIGVTIALALFVAVTRFGRTTPNYLEEARAAQMRGDTVAAISAMKSQLAIAPESSKTRLQLASLLRESDPDEALAVLRVIPESDANWTAALQETAIIHMLSGQTDEASAALEALVAVEPEHFGAQLSLAELYFNNHDPKKALPHAQVAAKLEPNRAQTFLLIADIHDVLQNYAMMIEPLQIAVDIDPDFYAAHLNLAYAHHRIGQLAEATTQAEWCLKKNSREVAALRILASVARSEGRFDDAEKWLAQALKVRPEDLDCRILEADLLLYQRQPQAAYERLKELYDSHSTTVRYLGALSRSAAAAGERDEARKLYQSVEELLQKSRAATP